MRICAVVVRCGRWKEEVDKPARLLLLYFSMNDLTFTLARNFLAVLKALVAFFRALSFCFLLI